MQFLEILKLSSLHGQERISRLRFARKNILAIAGILVVMLFTESALPLGNFALLFFLGMVPFIVLQYRLIFWRIKDITPESSDGQIWIHTLVAVLLNGVLPGVSYLVLQFWPSHKASTNETVLAEASMI